MVPVVSTWYQNNPSWKGLIPVTGGSMLDRNGDGKAEPIPVPTSASQWVNEWVSEWASELAGESERAREIER